MVPAFLLQNYKNIFFLHTSFFFFLLPLRAE